MASRKGKVAIGATPSPLAKVAATLCLVFSLSGMAVAQDTTVSPPNRAEVDGVANDLRKHPDLSPSKQEWRLKWIDRDKKKDETKPSVGWPWLGAFFAWLSHTARWFVWVIAAVLVAVLLVHLRRLWALRSPAYQAPELPPTHVQALDIRPEGLPKDLAHAVLALWQRGEHQAALSLLYRGTLSRLVHGHGVAIRAASTEGDCLRLARPKLSMPAQEWLESLINIWQLAVYAQRLPLDSQVANLCEQFDRHLGSTAAQEARP